MKILLHDYSGHAFTVQLARWFAAQGHIVQYWYSADIESPRGSLAPAPSDPENLHIAGVSLGESLDKYALATRFRQETAYARRVASLAREFRPDAVLSNAPPLVQNALRKNVQRRGGQFVYWLQDIYSAALSEALKGRYFAVGVPLGHFARRYEFAVLRASDRVICISEDFVPRVRASGVKANRCRVIQNWAALEELPVLPRDNAWRRANGLQEKFVFLFSGTLGLKHNPKLLSSLAHALKPISDAAVVVISQGMGRQWLEREKRAADLTNLHLFDFQPHEVLPEVLATGDVLIAILEPFAGELSVPSKILAYLCAGRPLLAALPKSNLSTRVLAEAQAGIAVDPLDVDAFLSKARELQGDGRLREKMGRSGRAYAEAAFDISVIGAKFLDAFARS